MIMNKVLIYLLTLMGSLVAFDQVHAEAIRPNGSPRNMQFAQFTPPEGWRYADVKNKLKYVQMMVVGKGQFDLPPSLSLASEPVQGTLKDYIKKIKEISESSGGTWKDLGMINTEAGEAKLIQEDIKTQWGELRNMYVVLIKNGMAYILTAAALKEEFATFYPAFFKAMRSLKIEGQPLNNEELTSIK